MPILTTLNCTFERKKKNHLNWFARRISVFDFSDSLFWIWIFCFLEMSHKCSQTSSAMVQLNENPHSSHRRWFVFIYIFRYLFGNVVQFLFAHCKQLEILFYIQFDDFTHNRYVCRTLSSHESEMKAEIVGSNSLWRAMVYACINIIILELIFICFCFFFSFFLFLTSSRLRCHRIVCIYCLLYLLIDDIIRKWDGMAQCNGIFFSSDEWNRKKKYILRNERTSIRWWSCAWDLCI